MTDNENKEVYTESNNSQFMNNPFMKLSNDLIKNWSPKITETAPKTWKSTLQLSSTANLSKAYQKQKEDLFLQDFLNAILPPIPTKITKTDNNSNDDNSNHNNNDTEEIVYSLTSTKQAKRSELNEIGNNFDAIIKERRARKVGLDNIRLQLAFQLFDEMIREVSIDCKERGLLLLRIRDQIKVTLNAYGILKEVGTNFSINQSEQSNKGFEELLKTQQELTERKNKLQNKLLKLSNEMREKQKEVKVLENVQSEQLKQHKNAIQDVTSHLKLLINSKKKRGASLRRRKSIKDTGRKSTRTRRNSIKDPNMTFSFN